MESYTVSSFMAWTRINSLNVRRDRAIVLNPFHTKNRSEWLGFSIKISNFALTPN